jgi:hypothetical protein
MLFLRSWRCHSRRCRRWIRPADSPHRSCSRSDEHWTKRSARDRQPSARRSPLSRGASALPKRPGGMCVLSFAARQYTETNACIRALATLLRDARSSTLRPLRRCESCNTYAGKYASDISCDLSSVEDTSCQGSPHTAQNSGKWGKRKSSNAIVDAHRACKRRIRSFHRHEMPAGMEMAEQTSTQVWALLKRCRSPHHPAVKRPPEPSEDRYQVILGRAGTNWRVGAVVAGLLTAPKGASPGAP